jgi:hypothetical protein
MMSVRDFLAAFASESTPAMSAVGNLIVTVGITPIAGRQGFRLTIFDFAMFSSYRKDVGTLQYLIRPAWAGANFLRRSVRQSKRFKASPGTNLDASRENAMLSPLNAGRFGKPASLALQAVCLSSLDS